MSRRFADLFRHFALALIVVVASASAVTAENIMTARQALDGVQDGSVILVDIRSRGEWRETGIASVAVPISMHEPGFVETIDRLQSENPGKTVALICAVGGRTAYMNELLMRRGFENIADVSEGMLGGVHGKGWIPAGLPIKSWTDE